MTTIPHPGLRQPAAAFGPGSLAAGSGPTLQETRSLAIRRPAGWPRKSGSRLPQSKGWRLIAVCLGDFIKTETGNRSHPSACCGRFELRGAAPRPIRSQPHQSMMTRILVNIIQPSQITLLVSEVRLTKVLPEARASRSAILRIQPFGGKAVQLLQKRTKAACITRRAVSHHMVMIREHRPRLEPPTLFPKKLLQQNLKPIPSLGCVQQMSLPSRTRRHKINPRLSQTMRRCMRPVARAFQALLVRRQFVIHGATFMDQARCRQDRQHPGLRQPAAAFGPGSLAAGSGPTLQETRSLAIRRPAGWSRKSGSRAAAVQGHRNFPFTLS